jgi:UDP-N-acetyl-D-mannosaminuronate dehydrogenase
MSYKLIKYVNNLYVYDQYFVENKVDKKIVFSNKLSKQRKFDAVIIAVPHDYIKKFSLKKIKSLIKKNGLILDLKSIFNKEEVNFQL